MYELSGFCREERKIWKWIKHFRQKDFCPSVRLLYCPPKIFQKHSSTNRQLYISSEQLLFLFIIFFTL